MELLLSVAGWGAFTLVVLIGLALNLVGLFGNWVILVAIAAVWTATGFAHFGPWTLLILLALAAVGEVLEMLAAGYGASRFGGGKGAALASLAGCIAGAIFATPWFPLIGTLVGAIAGAFLGAMSYELTIARKSPGDSFRTGFGAALGRTGAVLAKFFIGLVMLAVAFVFY